MIYHITSRSAWDEAKARGEYRAPSLESEGFIHCSTRNQLLQVANAFYRGRSESAAALHRRKQTRLRAALGSCPPIRKPLNASAIGHQLIRGCFLICMAYFEPRCSRRCSRLSRPTDRVGLRAATADWPREALGSASRCRSPQRCIPRVFVAARGRRSFCSSASAALHSNICR